MNTLYTPNRHQILKIEKFIQYHFSTTAKYTHISRFDFISAFGTYRPLLNYVKRQVLTRIQRPRFVPKLNQTVRTTHNKNKQRSSTLYGINAISHDWFNTLVRQTVSNKFIRSIYPLKKTLSVDLNSELTEQMSNGRYKTYAATLPAIVRESHLEGYTAVDIKSAHSTILYQVYQGLSTERLDAISDYLSNSNKFRKEWAAECRSGHFINIDYKHIKQFVTALFNGFKLINKDGTIRGYNSFLRTCSNLGIRRYSRITNHPKIIELARETHRMTVVLTTPIGKVKSFKNVAGFDSIIRYNKKGVALNMTPSRILSHMATGYEVLMLQTAFNTLKADNFVPVHDGFYVDADVDIAFLQSEVLTATGILVQYTSDII